jgi:hypothetical protein
VTEAAQPDHPSDGHVTARRFTSFDYDHPALGGLVYAFGAAITGVMVAAMCWRLRLRHSGRIGRTVAALGLLMVLWDRVVSHRVIKRRFADVPGEPPHTW